MHEPNFSVPPAATATVDRLVTRTDPWSSLKKFTNARIALGRTGGSWQTGTLLEFRLAHALAKDAVGQRFEADALEQQIRKLGCETARLTTDAPTRSIFLQRPDFGRRLSSGAKHILSQPPNHPAGPDLVILVSDGLSALAAERQAVPTLAALLPQLSNAGWTVGPILVIPHARVKVQDEIGVRLGARHTLILLGERPGLGSPDSLGAYFTYQPNPGKTDADRTCISNIRPEGLRPDLAGLKIARLLFESARQKCSGIGLKEPLAQANPALTV